MYERMKKQIGRGTPIQMGSTSTKAVTRAAIKAIKKDVPEIIVNQPPMRPALVLGEMFPTLGEWVARKATARFLRKVAFARRPTDDAA